MIAAVGLGHPTDLEAEVRLGHSAMTCLEFVARGPAPSREMAAERLDVPFSTFRRHVSKGLERLEEILWSFESGG